MSEDLRKVLIGCPVYERAWILPEWFTSLGGLASRPAFVFAYTPGNDGTLNVIKEHAPDAHIIEVTDGDHSIQRNWARRERLETMAYMRNTLLDYAASTDAHFYFSLDSDILVPRNIETLFSGVDRYDAIAPLAYLGIGDITNAFYETPKRHRSRAKVYDALQPVDVICAAKLMTRRVFTDPNVRYGFDSAGEDVYWSRTAREAGYRLGFDTRVHCKHVMERAKLGREDPRIGW